MLGLPLFRLIVAMVLMAAIMESTADADVPRDQARGSAKSRGATPAERTRSW
jgi:hypothetical protein